MAVGRKAPDQGDRPRVKLRSKALLSDGRVIVVAAGDLVPPGGVVVEGDVKHTASRSPVRSADVPPPAPPDSPRPRAKPKPRKRKAKR